MPPQGAFQGKEAYSCELKFPYKPAGSLSEEDTEYTVSSEKQGNRFILLSAQYYQPFPLL